MKGATSKLSSMTTSCHQHISGPVQPQVIMSHGWGNPRGTSDLKVKSPGKHQFPLLLAQSMSTSRCVRSCAGLMASQQVWKFFLCFSSPGLQSLVALLTQKSLCHEGTHNPLPNALHYFLCCSIPSGKATQQRGRRENWQNILTLQTRADWGPAAEPYKACHKDVPEERLEEWAHITVLLALHVCHHV